jgi:beta-phosphoglucomutase-like phosphatase (HAD superfamily)
MKNNFDSWWNHMLHRSHHFNLLRRNTSRLSRAFYISKLALTTMLLFASSSILLKSPTIALAFSSPPLPLPRGTASVVGPINPPATLSRRQQFPEKQGDDDGMYDGGDIYDANTFYYDGEYDIDLFDDKTFLGSVEMSENPLSENKIPEKDSLNSELSRWFEDRNQIKPIILTDLWKEDEEDDIFHTEEPPLVPVEDFSWFEPTLHEIEENYEQRLQLLQLSLDNDRRATPRTVPLEANDALEYVLREEMKAEIRAKLHAMRTERNSIIKKRKLELKMKESDQTKDSVNKLQPGSTQLRDPILMNGKKKDGDEAAKKLRKQALYVAAQAVSSSELDDSNSLNYWALDRMEEVLLKQQEAGDLEKRKIEEKLQALREQLESKASLDSGIAFQPEDYADWKKYQEIKAVEKEKSVDGRVDEALVRQRLIEYKEFLARQELTLEAFHKEERELEQKREMIRKFIPSEQKQQPRKFRDVVADINRKALNSLEEVLEKRRSENGEGTKELELRIEALRKSLEAVNFVDIEPKSTKKKVKVFKDEPIDFSDIFPDQVAKIKGDQKKNTSKEQKSRQRQYEGSNRAEEFKELDARLGEILPPTSLDPSDEDYSKTPDNFYYSSFDYVTDENEEDDFAPPPPPNTPFFTSLLDSEMQDYDDDDDEVLDGFIIPESDINKPANERSTSLLGTFEEQRMKNFLRQAGATTEEEKDQLLKSMEEFERYQEEMMRKYEQMDESDLGYNIADVLTEDGDIDADKVLSYIKAKPIVSSEAAATSSKISTNNAPAALETEKLLISNQETLKDKVSESLSQESQNIDVRKSPVISDVVDIPSDPEIIISQSISGVTDANSSPGERSTILLGTYEEQSLRNLIREAGLKDKEEQEKFKSDYLEFQRYQEEALRKFEEDENTSSLEKESTLPENANSKSEIAMPQNQISSAPVPISDGKNLSAKERKRLLALGYLSKPLSSSSEKNEENDYQPNGNIELGPKPTAAERKRRLAQGSSWNREAAVVESNTSDKGSFLGQEETSSTTTAGIENLSDDNSYYDDFEENRKRIEEAIGVRRSKGIDIYEALGRRPGDDYEEEYFNHDNDSFSRRNDVDLSSYLSRKSMLLERQSISVLEVNSLMDLKDNLETEGISPYVARVNKPFKEFGAIFRLEGVLVDVSSLQFRAWYRTAVSINMNPPSLEDVRLASVQTPEYAISRIFYWSNDFYLCQDIAAIQRKILKEEVKSAFSMNDEIGMVIDDNGRLEKFSKSEVSHEIVPNLTDTESYQTQQNDLKRTMYEICAERYGFRKPTEAELNIAVELPPRTAVEDVFEWYDPIHSVDTILATLKQIYESERRKQRKNNPVIKADSSDSQLDIESSGVFQLAVTDGAKSWIKALLEVEMPCGLISYLDEESVDLIMKATGLDALIPVDKRVTFSSGYPRESFQQLGASIRIDRRPDMCVLFDGNADALNAARDNEMKSVGMTCIYPSYELLAADMTARNFDYLTAMNIRRLFGSRDNQEPLLEVALLEPSPPKRKVLTMYPDDNHGDGSSENDLDVKLKNYQSGDQNERRYSRDLLSSKRSTPHKEGVIFESNDAELFQ